MFANKSFTLNFLSDVLVSREQWYVQSHYERLPIHPNLLYHAN